MTPEDIAVLRDELASQGIPSYEAEWLGPSYNQPRGYSPIQSFNAG